MNLSERVMDFISAGADIRIMKRDPKLKSDDEFKIYKSPFKILECDNNTMIVARLFSIEHD